MFKNYIYQFLYQILNIIFPLVTLSYVSRVLGAENIGMYTYSFTIISYLLLISDLGIKKYGSREIAYFRENKEKVNYIFFNLLFQKIILSLIIYLISFIFFYLKKYDTVFHIQVIYIALSFLDLSWFYEGLEDFKKIMVRNFFIKILLIISIFYFIKEKQDLIKYTAIMLFSNTIGNLLFWYKLPIIKIREIKFNKMNPFKNINATFIMFLPQIAISVYTSIDKIMLGKMTSKSNVAYYDISHKLIILSMIVITTAGIVFLPQIANLYKKKEINKIKEIIYKTLNLYIIIALPLIFGIISISDLLIPKLFDSTYYQVIPLIKLMSCIILLWTLNNITGSYVLIPMGMEKKLTMTVFIGCFFNIILNFILIPKYQAFGAVIATLLTESIVTALQIKCSKEYFKISYLTVLKSLISAILMYVFLEKINILILNIILGPLIYFLILFLLKEKQFIDFTMELKKILIKKNDRR